MEKCIGELQQMYHDSPPAIQEMIEEELFLIKEKAIEMKYMEMRYGEPILPTR
jgi:hypothetical protein